VERRPQFVRLLLQLSHPLHLHGQVATDLLDLAFKGTWKFRASDQASLRRAPRETSDFSIAFSPLI
jgi:hypothetical protein